MPFARYPSYRDSGISWLGELPAHWGKTRLRFLTECLDGKRIPLNAEQRASRRGEIPYWGANCVLDHVDGALFDEPLILLGEDGAPFFDHTKPVAFFSNGPVWPNNHVHVLRPRDISYGRFLVYALNCADYAEYVDGSTRDKLTQSQMNNIAVPWPSPGEQGAIVAFLDRKTGKIDALIAEQEELIALLKEKRQVLISHAVTKGLDPYASMKDSGIEWLGDVPAHWKSFRLGALFREASDLGNDDLPILSVSIHDGVSDKELDESEMDRKVTRSEDRSTYKAVQPGDLAYNMMRAWQGGFGAVTVHGQVSPAYVVARPVSNVRTSFIEQLLRTPHAVEQMRRHSRGITDFRLRLYWEEFKNIPVALPPLAEQDAILAHLAREASKFDELTRQTTHSIDLLKERRSALISAAVTGKIDVRSAL